MLKDIICRSLYFPTDICYVARWLCMIFDVARWLRHCLSLACPEVLTVIHIGRPWNQERHLFAPTSHIGTSELL